MAISLADVTAKGQRLKPPKVVLYGVGGIGKSTFAASAPNPYFIMTEEGQGALDIARYEIREGDPVVRSWQEILDCLTLLSNEDHDYKTVVIDTIDFAEPLMWKHTCEKHNKPDIESFGYAKGYTYTLDDLRVLLAGLDWLRNNKNMIIILLAHSDVKKFDLPDSTSFDRWRLRMHEKAAAIIHDWSDAVLFANYRAHVVKDDAGFGKERARAVGHGERVVFTEERPAWLAKNRYSLPSELILPKENSWMVFQNAIVAAQSASLPKEG